jgi:hypothetical protein
VDGVDERNQDPALAGSCFVGFSGYKCHAEVLGFIIQPFGKKRRLKKAIRALFFRSRRSVGSEKLVETAWRQGLVERSGGRQKGYRLPSPIYRTMEKKD